MPEDDTQPMLEMAPLAGDGDEEAPATEPRAKPAETNRLATEYAVGTGVPHGWDEEDPDTDDCDGCPCGGAARRVSNHCCAALGAKRLGNMAVLRHTTLAASSETAAGGARAETSLDCVVGPFWPFTLCVTYPLILLVSGAVAVSFLPDHAVVTWVVWVSAVAALLVALSCVACRDPGVLRRHPEKPHARWRWNDQARTYRPPGAAYDEDLGLIVTGFDHVCPWTGTGIGEKNMGAFHAFVSLLCVCIVLDVLIIMHVLP